MLKNFIPLIFCICLSLGSSVAQDIHYSQFFNSPLNVNPGLTGMFNGDTRVYANYRKQWQNVPVDYLSMDVAADFKLRREGKKNFIGLGGLINYDKAGDVNVGLTGLNAFAAYTYFINDNNLISPAINAVFSQRRHESSLATTSNQWDGIKFNPTLPAEFIGQDSQSYFDIGLGINYRWQKNYRTHLDLGVGGYHLISPTDRFRPSATYTSKRPLRLSFTGMLNYKITDDLDLLLNALYAKQDVYKEIVINAQGKIYLSKAKDKALYLGAGYRFGDAWYPMIALEIGNIYGSFSYDFNISDFDIATDGRGGPELSIRYILAKIPQGIYKPCLIY